MDNNTVNLFQNPNSLSSSIPSEVTSLTQPVITHVAQAHISSAQVRHGEKRTVQSISSSITHKPLEPQNKRQSTQDVGLNVLSQISSTTQLTSASAAASYRTSCPS